MDKAKVINTQLAILHFKLSTRHCHFSDGKNKNMKQVPYASLVGS